MRGTDTIAIQPISNFSITISLQGKKGYIPSPERIELGEVAHRQYGEQDLAYVRAINGFMDEGFTSPVAA